MSYMTEEKYLRLLAELDKLIEKFSEKHGVQKSTVVQAARAYLDDDIVEDLKSSEEDEEVIHDEFEEMRKETNNAKAGNKMVSD